ncbi:hypothetical protein GCM10009101_20020 [Brevundimonas lenta]
MRAFVIPGGSEQSELQTRNPAARESANLSRTQLADTSPSLCYGAAGFRVSAALRPE